MERSKKENFPKEKSQRDVSFTKKTANLIWSLSKNDFKTKFAGSYFGIIWAFIQPIVTVLVYWFVFEKGLSASAEAKGGGEIAFVLWLVSGIVPWFFFQEAINSGTGALIEYSYLVKQVVFPIHILPVIKVVSALFVHLFFMVFTVVIFALYGYFPDIYVVQIVYYSFCMIVLVIGITYMTSAVAVFFKDLTQLINIVLQVGIWLTPIMWDLESGKVNVPGFALSLLRLNPMYYIVNGYRDAMINKIWFWEYPGLTLYYWVFCLVLMAAGYHIFKKLKVHFADVL